jgi:hypothetical protein
MHFKSVTYWIWRCSFSSKHQLFSDKTANTYCTKILNAVLLNGENLFYSFGSFMLGLLPKLKDVLKQEAFSNKYSTSKNIQNSFKSHLMSQYIAMLQLNEMSNIHWGGHDHCLCLFCTYWHKQKDWMPHNNKDIIQYNYNSFISTEFMWLYAHIYINKRIKQSKYKIFWLIEANNLNRISF